MAEKSASPAVKSQVTRPGQAAALQAEGQDQPLLALQRAAGNRAVTGMLGPLQNDPPAFPTSRAQIEAAMGAGEPLSGGLRSDLEGQLGDATLGQVQIHRDAQADLVARAMNADALATGQRMVFRHGLFQPGTASGRALLLHEARHIAAGRATGGTLGNAPVQLRISVLDVRDEMVGLYFKVRRTQGAAPKQIPAGATVEVTSWGAGATAEVRYTTKGISVSLDVPKLELEPASASGAGVRRYSVGLGAQQTAVDKSQQKAEKASQETSQFKGEEAKFSKNHKAWERQLKVLEAEQIRLEGELQRKTGIHEQMLIRETMYNRFDPLISKWVGHYNTEFKPATPLDPNVVKSILFQETRMGTSGEHLMSSPYNISGGGGAHPIKSRFNLGQTIDSAGPQQLIMMKEMAPHIYSKYKLEDLEKKNRQKGMTNSEFDAWNGGDFNLALKEFLTERDPSGKNLMGTPGKDLYEDYGFWIRAAVRWLFVKYHSLSTPSWPEAVRAYNGSGPGAKKYRQEVMGRVKDQSTLVVGSQ